MEVAEPVDEAVEEAVEEADVVVTAAATEDEFRVPHWSSMLVLQLDCPSASLGWRAIH